MRGDRLNEEQRGASLIAGNVGARVEDMGRVYTPTKLCGHDLGQVTEGLWVSIYPQGFRRVGSACT